MTVWSTLFLGLLISILVGGGRALYMRRGGQDPRGFIRLEFKGYRSATVVYGFGEGFAGRLVVLLLAATGLVAGIEAWAEIQAGALILVGFGVYLIPIYFFMQTGRFGDGSLWLTPEGIHQHIGGVEAGVRWDDITRVVPTPTGALLTCDTGLIRRRRVPRIWTGKGAAGGPQTMLVQLGNFHTDLHQPLIESIVAWARSPQERHELGTNDSVQRLVGPWLASQ